MSEYSQPSIKTIVMTEPKRLFDCIEYHLNRTPIKDMLAGKENGSWKTYSTQMVSTLVNQLSAGLFKLGLGPGDMSIEGRDKIAIICKNRPEWVILDLAVQKLGAILIPIYPTINVNELAFILNDSSAKAIFVNDKELFDKVNSIKDRINSIQHIYTFENVEGANHWGELLELADEKSIKSIEEIAASIKSEDLATVLYTSGTTGTPKGVMLTHKNILSNVLASFNCLPPFEDMRALSFLPLNHIFEKMITYYHLYKGTAIYYAESMETIADNLREVKPTLFSTVPRLLEKVYEKIMAKGAELKGIKKRLFFWAHELASKYEINKNQGWWYNFQLKIANKLIFSKWREALGNNVLAIVSGGAACQVRLIRIFTAAQIPILEGYGLTETSPVISVNRYNVQDRYFGTVGPVIDGVQVKIAEDGEILCKGDNIMLGYYKRSDLTAEAIVDGWYHTGDIGTIVEGRFLKITDRKKEMFKTSGGKYVAPLPIENKFKESVFIEQIMVIGAGKKFVSALIVPAFPNLIDWAKRNNVEYTTNEALIQDPRVIEQYQKAVDKYNEFFNHVEQIKKFKLCSKEWSIDTGELTPKLSLKRKVVMEKFHDVIESMYE